MSRNVQIVLLCEDSQHEAFARRFLEQRGWSTHRLRVEKASRGSGSAEQFVRERFPIELGAYRQSRTRVGQTLIVIVDGDSRGVAGRVAQLNAECAAAKQPVRRSDERVGIFVPTWSIETWFAYLDGQMVDETRTYPRLTRERDCQRHAVALTQLCDQGHLRQPAPLSLEVACDEFKGRIMR